MADHNNFVHDYNHDPHDPMQNFDDIFGSDESLGIEFDTADNPFVDNLDDVGNNINYSSGWDQAGPSGVNNQTSEQNAGENSNFGNPIPLPLWPLPPAAYNCSCCQVLREITHTKGIETTIFEVHGRTGMIFHGILVIRVDDGTGSNKNYQMFDFCKKSIDDVKQFLLQYCQEREKAGYNIVKDPFVTFYQTLCSGFYYDRDANIEGGQNQGDQQPQAEDEKQKKKEKRSKVAQNALAKSLDIKHLTSHFHLKLDDAAKALDICSTVLKNVSRSYGIKKWPSRKVKSLNNKIDAGNASLQTIDDASERAGIEAEIRKYEEQKDKIYKGPYEKKAKKAKT